MNRGGRLARRTRLTSDTPLAPMSHKRLEAVRAAGRYPTSTFAPKRPEPAVPPATRLSLSDRSGLWCEAQLEDCWGRATDPHHRVVRGIGGVHGEAKVRADELSDVMDLCRSCHRWVHAYPEAANVLGLLLKRHQQPLRVPVLYRGEPMYLDDAGGVHDFEKAGA
jgi:hypothetical protein